MKAFILKTARNFQGSILWLYHAAGYLRQVSKQIVTVSVLLFAMTSSAQTPSMVWQKCYGGSGNDSFSDIKKTSDGGYVATGRSTSSNGDLTANKGANDFWVVKLTSDGSVTWSKSFGGSKSDLAYKIVQTPDNGFIVVGSTQSNDGDVTGLKGFSEAWVIRLSSSGALLWSKCLGGSGSEEARDVICTKNGNYVIAITSNSTDGSVIGNHGLNDGWLVMLNDSGDIIQQRSFGGTKDDAILSIQQTSDDGYILAGTTRSSDGDVSGFHGQVDIWLVKTDAQFAITWQKCYGGPSYIASPGKVLQESDGGYFIGGRFINGTPGSGAGDMTGNKGSWDFWAIKTASDGTMLIQKNLGGSMYDYGTDAINTSEGGWMMVGGSASDDGDVIGSHGDNDFWVVKLDASGSVSWQLPLGGSSDEEAQAMLQTDSCGYIIAGASNSTDGDLATGNKYGGSDAWIVNLAVPPATPSVTIQADRESARPGQTVTFTASAVNEGTGATFQWKKNGNNVGTDSKVYTDNSLVNGDVVSLVMTTATTCVIQTATSNNLSIEIESLMPVISSMSPSSGPVGSSVTLSGLNFSPVAANNIVYFGSGRAVVTAAGATQLTVTVPAGFTHELVTVTTGGLTGSSKLPFKVTFAGGQLSPGSFVKIAELSTPQSKLIIRDFDGDGWADILCGNVIFRNAGTPTLSFQKVTLPFAPPVDTEVTDLNGDGKPDLVTANSPALSGTRLNTSVPGAISFENLIPYGSRTDWSRVYVIDPRGTGIPELRYNVNIENSQYLYYHRAIDMDGDGKADQLVNSEHVVSGSAFSIEKNNSTPSTESFSQVFLSTGAGTGSYTTHDFEFNAVDFDGDGLNDLTNRYAVWLNTGSIGAFSLTNSPVTFDPSRYGAGSPAIGDLDGDGKPELVASLAPSSVNNTAQFQIYPNTGSAGTISFGQTVNYFLSSSLTKIPVSPAIADLDNDGRADLVIVSGDDKLAVLRNITTMPDATIPVITSFSVAATAPGDSMTITGQNFTGLSAVIFQGIPTTFSNATITQVTVVVPQGFSGGYVTLITPAGSASKAISVLQPTVSAFTPVKGGPGTSMTITGTNFLKVSEVSVGAMVVESFVVNSATSITAVLAAGGTGGVTVTTPSGYDHKEGFSYFDKPRIVARSRTTMPQGESVTLTASPALPAAETYQWTKDGVEIATGPIYTTSAAGTYTVEVKNVTNTVSDPIQVITVFQLPASNFTVKASDESCRSSNDGQISISAAQVLNYIATLNGGGFTNATYTFQNSVDIKSLVAGNYSVCLTIAEQPSYKQCFDVTITEPEDLSVYTTLDVPGRILHVTLSGSDVYNIDFNGKSYKTSTRALQLPVVRGTNLLKVTGGALCQGIIEKTFLVTDETIVYPNPFDSEITVAMPASLASAQVDVSTLSGRSVYRSVARLESGRLKLDLRSLESGMYILTVITSDGRMAYKIIKK